MNMRRFARFGLVTVLAIVLLAACATQPIPGTHEPPGFLLGLVHGFISPFALMAELFTNVRIYAFPNSGGWYDLGFMIGLCAFVGGGSRAA
jgi:hypothetical protein